MPSNCLSEGKGRKGRLERHQEHRDERGPEAGFGVFESHSCNTGKTCENGAASSYCSEFLLYVPHLSLASAKSRSLLLTQCGCRKPRAKAKAKTKTGRKKQNVNESDDDSSSTSSSSTTSLTSSSDDENNKTENKAGTLVLNVRKHFPMTNIRRWMTPGSRFPMPEMLQPLLGTKRKIQLKLDDHWTKKTESPDNFSHQCLN